MRTDPSWFQIKGAFAWIVAEQHDNRFDWHAESYEFIGVDFIWLEAKMSRKHADRWTFSDCSFISCRMSGRMFNRALSANCTMHDCIVEGNAE